MDFVVFSMQLNKLTFLKQPHLKFQDRGIFIRLNHFRGNGFIYVQQLKSYCSLFFDVYSSGSNSNTNVDKTTIKPTPKPKPTTKRTTTTTSTTTTTTTTKKDSGNGNGKYSSTANRDEPTLLFYI